MASRLPATATTEACQALAGRSAGSTRLLNIGGGGGGLGITCQPPPLPRKHSASKSCSNSIRLTRHQRKRMVAELNPFRCSNSHHWCDAFNHLHYPRADYSRASATWASACVLSPPSPGHSRWGPWTAGHCTEARSMLTYGDSIDVRLVSREGLATHAISDVPQLSRGITGTRCEGPHTR
ncbi:hypothetical protein E2C01_003434 [Portunus trituberculatus]|uniref:Uncharacterized protein n=1 Tax=Portunus trituberculatus TaxID=210409 RepID=A0A5B7CQ53_PORTR|nr:hypothetical protein [Portunus trituberculatus]